MKERQPRLAVIEADSLHTAALSVDQGEQTLIYLYVFVMTGFQDARKC